MISGSRKTGDTIILNKKEKFVVWMSITTLEHIPLRYAEKRHLFDSDYLLIDSLLEKMSDEDDRCDIELDENEKKLLLEAIENCVIEEHQSVLQTGKSVGFQNYLSNNFGDIDEDAFIAIARKIAS